MCSFTHTQYNITHTHNVAHTQMKVLFQELVLKTVLLANLNQYVVMTAETTPIAVNSESRTA